MRAILQEKTILLLFYTINVPPSEVNGMVQKHHLKKKKKLITKQCTGPFRTLLIYLSSICMRFTLILYQHKKCFKWTNDF